MFEHRVYESVRVPCPCACACACVSVARTCVASVQRVSGTLGLMRCTIVLVLVCVWRVARLCVVRMCGVGGVGAVGVVFDVHVCACCSSA